MTIPIQLSLQGGGAKLALLLAAAEAISDLQERKIIEVRRIAGTSAGAIVGSFLAIGADIKKIRMELAGDEGNRLLKEFKLPPWPLLTISLVRGARVWSDEPLRVWLKRHFKPFEETVGGLPKFDDLPKHGKPPLSVVATNLTTGTRYEASGGADIIEAVLASAGLPFCFRTWKNENGGEILVDGGICKNLPIDSLLKHEPNDGPIVAFAFPHSRPETPTGPFEFAKALLDAAITDSVESAKQQLDEANICALKSDALQITTFNFRSARAFLQGNEYDNTRARVSEWFERLAARERIKASRIASGQITDDVWSRPHSDASRVQMAAIGRIYHHAHAREKFRYHNVRLTVHANCLATKGHSGFGKPDDVKYEFEFEPAERPIVAHRLTLSSSSATKEFVEGYNVQFWSANGLRTKIESLAATIPGSDMLRELVVFFVPQLEPGSGRYHLSLTDYGTGLFKKLLNPQISQEFIQLSLDRATGLVGRVEIILHVPREFRRITLVEPNEVSFSPAPHDSASPLQGKENHEYTTYVWECRNCSKYEIRADFVV